MLTGETLSVLRPLWLPNVHFTCRLHIVLETCRHLFICFVCCDTTRTVKPLGLRPPAENPPRPRRCTVTCLFVCLFVCLLVTNSFNSFPVCGYSVPQGGLAAQHSNRLVWTLRIFDVENPKKMRTISAKWLRKTGFEPAPPKRSVP